jgi:transposase-like protein
VTDTNVFQFSQPGTFSDPLTDVLRSGARALLAQAVEAEIMGLLSTHADKLTADGRQRLVRHGYLPEREIMTGVGPVAVRCPRVRDRVGEGSERIHFSSALLPPYARRSKSLEVLIPILYLKGVSTGDFEEALVALLGKDAGGLSAATVGRLKQVWSEEHLRWSKRDLSAKHYVYVWADGIHVQARLEDAAQCLLVIIGATPEGKKELVGLIDGVRESAQSWPARFEATRACDRARARGRRRRTRLLAGDRGTMAQDPRPALLGAQDRQRAQQTAEEPAIESQAGAAGDLDG